MAKFRKSQKMFIAPFLAGAGKLLGSAMNIGFIGSSVAGVVQGNKSNKLMAEQNVQMERQALEQQKIEQKRLEQEKKWQEEQLKLQKKALKKGVNPFGDSSILNNTTGTPTTPLQPPPAIYQTSYSEESQKEYSTFSFAKDMALLASRNKGKLVGSVLTGVSTTVGVYTADRAIRKDKEKTKRQVMREKGFSNKRISLTGPVFSFALGAAAPAISYAAEKKLQEDMLKDTQSEENTEKKSNPKYKEKSYSGVAGVGKVLNKISLLSGGGGAKGMQSLGIQIAAIGKRSGNKTTQKLGKAIIDNPKAATLVSIPGGAVLISGGITAGDKVTTKVIEKLDPDAFGYIKSKEEEVEE